jgi:hypothetical protein
MIIRIPEKNKKAGVYYALSDDGVELPVIDITHSAFAIYMDEATLAGHLERFYREEERQKKLPEFLRRLLFRLVLSRSILGRGIMQAQGGFLNAMNTYLMKLGPDNLGRGYAKGIDRRIAASLPCLSMRLRLQDMARLLAEGLAPALETKPGRPLWLLNIAGGPASDSLNALIVLNAEHPGWLAGRKIQIQILDLDPSGPAFAGRALESLLAKGAPLHGLDASLHHQPYNWTRAEDLHQLLADATAPDAVMATSSEGGLFEYGSDEEIVANLEVLRDLAPANGVVVGSVTPDDGPVRVLKDSSRVSTHPRSLKAFSTLASRAGWSVADAIERPFCRNVRLARA